MNDTEEVKDADCQETDASEDCHEKADLFFPLTEMKIPHSILPSDDSSGKTLPPYQQGQADQGKNCRCYVMFLCHIAINGPELSCGADNYTN
jgi:hypothetical protein